MHGTPPSLSQVIVGWYLRCRPARGLSSQIPYDSVKWPRTARGGGRTYGADGQIVVAARHLPALGACSLMEHDGAKRTIRPARLDRAAPTSEHARVRRAGVLRQAEGTGAVGLLRVGPHGDHGRLLAARRT